MAFTPRMKAAVTAIFAGTSSLVQLLPRVAYSPHDHTTRRQSLQASSVPGGDHQPLRLAVLSLLPQLSGRQGIDGDEPLCLQLAKRHMDHLALVVLSQQERDLK